MIQKLRDRREGGFTLIELLIVVAIIGIIAAILIPNLIDALQKAKQKRAVADIRTVGGAWFSWYTDQQAAASAGAAETYTWQGAGMTSITYANLLALLQPTPTMFYIQKFRAGDPWKSDYQYAITDDLTPKNLAQIHSNVIAIRSGGRDGAFDADYPVGGFLATDYDQDIVWADGYFVRYPSGSQAVATP